MDDNCSQYCKNLINENNQFNNFNSIDSDISSNYILPSEINLDNNMIKLFDNINNKTDNANENETTLDITENDTSILKNIFKKKEIINNKYKIIKFIDIGTLGSVYKAYNLTDKVYCVLKIIKGEFDFQYNEEAKMNEIINKIPNKTYFVKMRESFEFYKNNKKYYIFVNELLGYNLYKFLKYNEFRGFHLEDIQNIAKQLLTGIKILHKNKIVHTDIKPENILFTESKCINVTNKTKLPFNVSQLSNKQKYKKPYKRLINTKIKIIDFGNACKIKDLSSGIETICTRQYRPPEVILKCEKYDEKVDIWSLGCILLEIYTGQIFFKIDCRDELADIKHLANIEKACGHYPKWMIEHSINEDLSEIFVKCAKHHFNDYVFLISNIGSNDECKKVIDSIHEQRTIPESIWFQHISFRYFIQSLLQIDPKKRPTAKKALKHQFFKTKFNK